MSAEVTGKGHSGQTEREQEGSCHAGRGRKNVSRAASVSYVKCNERSELEGHGQGGFRWLPAASSGVSMVTAATTAGLALRRSRRAPEMFLLPLASPPPSAPPAPPSLWYGQVPESWEQEAVQLSPQPPRRPRRSPGTAPPAGPFWPSRCPRRRKPLREGRMPARPGSARGRNLVWSS